MTMITLISLMMFLLPAEKQTLSSNEHVNIEMHVPTALSAAKPAVLAFWMTPVEGIHINSTPVVELRLEKDSPFELVGSPRFQKDDKEYLEISQPVEFTVKAKKGMSPGKQRLKGTLNYFYCSDKEGWCNRFSQKIEATVVIQ